MDKDYLILKRASASHSSGEWNDGDFDVLANSEVAGRIFEANAGQFAMLRLLNGSYCACNRNATCFGADHGPFGRRPSHRAERRAELRCRDSR